MVTRRGFRTRKQQKAFFARGNFKKFTAFSYIDGKRLGTFTSLGNVFKKFPKEGSAFRRVQRFNKTTGRNIKTVRQIPNIKRKMNISRRWDR